MSRGNRFKTPQKAANPSVLKPLIGLVRIYHLLIGPYVVSRLFRMAGVT